MRVSNIDYGRNGARPASMGQFKSPREVAFRIIDENGYHVVNPGKKFPFTVSSMVWADGTSLQSAPLKGTALSETEGPASSVVRVQLNVPQDPNNFARQDLPVDATLSLFGVNGDVTYPIFENRRIRFTVPPASPLPLDLEAIYGAYEADKYAEETARLDQIMAEQYAAMIRTEEEAKAAAEKAAQAAQAAAAKKKAAEDAVEAATNAASARNKKILYTIGGVAAIGLLAYLAFKSD